MLSSTLQPARKLEVGQCKLDTSIGDGKNYAYTNRNEFKIFLCVSIRHVQVSRQSKV